MSVDIESGTPSSGGIASLCRSCVCCGNKGKSMNLVAPEAYGHQVSRLQHNNSKPTIEQVLYNLRKYPLTRDVYRIFLEAELAEENIDFWHLSEQYRQKYEDVDKISVVAAVPPVDDPGTQGLFAHKIFDRFIKVGADAEINLRGTQQSAIASCFHSDGTFEAKDGIFADAQWEVLQLMQGDPFNRFVEFVSEKNLTPSEVDNRYRVSFLSGVFALVFTIVLVALQTTNSFPEVFHNDNHRLYRLAVVPVVWLAVKSFNSARKKL